MTTVTLDSNSLSPRSQPKFKHKPRDNKEELISNSLVYLDPSKIKSKDPVLQLEPANFIPEYMVNKGINTGVISNGFRTIHI